MTDHSNYDLVIVGAGIIGISAGIAALESKPSLRVLILDKSKQVAEHASGRNSGVLHAGFYYSPDSLKARFCRDGNSEMKILAKRFNVTLNECGKVVVAKNASEALRLEALYTRGIANGVDIEILPESRLVEFEPHAMTSKKFIWSPTTSIMNPIGFLKGLLSQYISMGGKIEFDQEVEFNISKAEISLTANGKQLGATKIINAAGAQSDSLARKIGVGKDYLVIPFKGNYRKSNIKSASKRLIYPVPHEVNPFLGVHTSLTIDGFLKIGPTAMPALGRENYEGFRGIRVSELPELFSALIRLAKSTNHDLVEIIKMELPLLIEKQLIKSVSNLMSEDLQVYQWTKLRSGIRSQLINIHSGDLVQDFVVEKKLNSMHFLNVVSPGWTSALPFTRHFVSEFIR